MFAFSKKHLMLKKLILIFSISFTVAQAQYTDLINSNQPGFSKNPYSVGLGVYQFEANLFHRRHQPNRFFDTPVTTGLNLDFRTSFFFERLELSLNTQLVNEKQVLYNVFESEIGTKLGLSNFTLGAKYLVFKPKYKDMSKIIRSWKKRHSFDLNRLIPHVGVYAGYNIRNFLIDAHNIGNSPKVGILLLNELDLRYNFVTNVYYDNIGSDFAEWSYILTATYLFSERWSGFLEHQAKFNAYENTSNAGGGLTYLFSRDLQINSSLRATFQESGLGFQANVGMSYRINRHVDKFIPLDEFGNPIEFHEGKKKRGFFGRLFDSVKRLFKKTEEVEIDDIDEDGTPITKKVKIPTTERKRQKSVLGKIIKRDKKIKKKKDKEEKKAMKKAERRKEKEERKAEKKRRKEEDKKVTELTKKLREKEELLESYQRDKDDLALNSGGGISIYKEEKKEDEGQETDEENVDENTDENNEEAEKEEISTKNDAEKEIDAEIKRLKEEIKADKKVIEEVLKRQNERRQRYDEEQARKKKERKEALEKEKSKKNRKASIPKKEENKNELKEKDEKVLKEDKGGVKIEKEEIKKADIKENKEEK